MSSYLMDASRNEEARLNALRDLRLLDTPPSESFDRITRLASRLMSAPVSTISLTDGDRQWFKSKVGVDLDEIPREKAPCSYAIRSGEVFIVPDLLEDPRFRDSPLAHAGIRFYAGAPLHTRAGYGLGTICVVDAVPRELGTDEQRVLKDLAGMVMSQIELQNLIGRVDATSGVPNQHQFFEDIEAIARRAPSQTVAGLLVDLVSRAQADHGTHVLGAGYTEAMVGGALQRIMPMIGNASSLYHVGPTRCAVLLPPETLVDVEDLSARIMEALRESIDCGGVPVSAVPAIGLYAFLAGEQAPRDVLRRLFNAVEDARASDDGKAEYSPSRDLHRLRSFTLLNDFKAATVGVDQLSLAYQPRVALKSGLCVGAEALLRWRHPRLGNISPAEFVPVVEQTALVRPMMDWVLETALGEARAWKRSGFGQKLSINASALNLDEVDFAERLMRRIGAAGVEPAQMQLEFTESAMARDDNRVVEQLMALRGYGIDIAIDDFGTGHSNLGYLQKLPATILKIDRSFITDIMTVERDRKLVRTMISMAHDLGYHVVAEGIETQDAYDLLAEWGCDEGQGYLMSRPVHSADVRRRLGAAAHWAKFGALAAA